MTGKISATCLNITAGVCCRAGERVFGNVDRVLDTFTTLGPRESLLLAIFLPAQVLPEVQYSSW